MTVPCIVVAFALTASCSRTPPGHIALKLDRDQSVSVGLFDARGTLVAQPISARRLAAGGHLIDCSPGSPEGTWSWRAIGVDAPQPELLASLAAGVSDLSRADELGSVAGGDAGPPCSVAADAESIFLGWRAAVAGQEVVAVDPNGKVLWAHHHGPGKSGVCALAASDGVVFVLGSGESEDSAGAFIYKLDAHTGSILPWKGREGADLHLDSLWPQDDQAKSPRGNALAAKNGRVYVTFARDEFIAVLDGTSGAYVITLTGPAPTQMALSTTPMTDPEKPGQIKIIDFGVCAVAGNGIAYFVMEHEPAWVMASTTRWLQEDEHIVGIALTGDTMKTGEATIYTALGEPHHQVQLRSVDSAETFTKAVGQPGGRAPTGAWQAEALRNIHAIAVDGAGQLWVAESDGRFGRFSVWRTDGKQGTLVREIFGPMEGQPSPGKGSPLLLTAGELEWEIDRAKHQASLISILPTATEPGHPIAELRDASGLLLWTPNASVIHARLTSGNWTIWRGPDALVYGGCSTPLGTHVFAFPGLEKSRSIGNGKVTVARK